jgi:hypothetical protein
MATGYHSSLARKPPRSRTRRSRHRLLIAGSAALLVGLLAAPVADAAVPSNDDSANATPLTAFPVHRVVDLSEATIQGDEPYCGGQVASVWYRYVAPAEGTLTVAVPDTEPATRVCVLPDSISAGTYRIVSPSETVNMLVDAGRTYFILLGSTEAGQSATLALDVGPPYFDLTVTLDPKGLADHVSGAAIVGGTLACSASAPVFLQVQIWEKVNSKKSLYVSDYRYPVACSAVPTRWDMRLYANTAFVPGQATVSVYAGGGDDVDQFTAAVKLGAK